MKSALTQLNAGAKWKPMGWALALAAGLVLLVATVLPPFVGPGLRGVLMAALDPLCHQLPARSFVVDGVPFAACHRCTGVFAGLVLGVLALPLLRTWTGRLPRVSEAVLLLIAVVPAALDWTGDVLGLWENTAATRVATGLWFGLVAGWLFARALALGTADETATPSTAR